MKLAFTTLGCPDWDLNTIIFRAKQYGFDGVDFRGYRSELDVTFLPEFTLKRKETSLRLKDAGLDVPCFSSSVRMFTTDSSAQRKYDLEIVRYARLCQLFDAPYLRIFGGKIGDVCRERAIDIAIKNLMKMAKIGEEHNVSILLETHDDWLDCYLLKMLMESVASDFLGILWDIHNPYVLIKEKPRTTWQTIGKWIRYTHWKDAKIDKNSELGYQISLMGEGDLPLRKIFNLVKNGGYDGYLTFEWEKRWYPEIPAPEVAFPQYIKFMKENF